MDRRFGERAVVGDVAGDVAAVHGSPVTRKRIDILFIIGSSATCFSVSVALGANVYSARLRLPITPLPFAALLCSQEVRYKGGATPL